MSELIDFIGTFPEGKIVYGDFTLSDGRIASVIYEPRNLCIKVGGLAARYPFEELSRIGDGDPSDGEVRIIRSVVADPMQFQFGCTPPCAVEPSRLIIVGKTH